MCNTPRLSSITGEYNGKKLIQPEPFLGDSAELKPMRQSP
jgi:hypothetical protein